MKKWLISLFFVLGLPFYASANDLVVRSPNGEPIQIAMANAEAAQLITSYGGPVSGGAATTDACSSCQPGDPTDYRCEDFDGANSIFGGTTLCADWSLGSGTDIFDPDYTTSASMTCSYNNTEVMEVDATSNSGTARWEPQSEPIFLVIFINLRTKPSAKVDMFELQQSGGQLITRFQLQTDGTLRTYIYRDNGGCDLQTHYSTNALSLNYWNRIEIKYDNNAPGTSGAQSATLYYNGGSEDLLDGMPETDTCDRAMGRLEWEGASGAVYEIGPMLWDDDTMPTCS